MSPQTLQHQISHLSPLLDQSSTSDAVFLEPSANSTSLIESQSTMINLFSKSPQQDPSDADIEQAVHASFRGQCFLTVPGLELKSGFAMKVTMPFYWPPPKKGVPRREQPCATVIGQHYALVPVVDMTLDTYTAEMERLPAVPCALEASAEPPAPDDILEPSDGVSAARRPSLKLGAEAAPAYEKGEIW
eukprot:gene17358-23660_t